MKSTAEAGSKPSRPERRAGVTTVLQRQRRMAEKNALLPRRCRMGDGRVDEAHALEMVENFTRCTRFAVSSSRTDRDN